MRISIAAAAAVLLTGSGWSAPAAASDWGCQVLLCLANPGGPTQYGACVPPVTKLWDTLATGGSFPICSEGDVAKTKIHGKHGSSDDRVTMTYRDGSQQTYPLAGMSQSLASALTGSLEQP